MAQWSSCCAKSLPLPAKIWSLRWKKPRSGDDLGAVRPVAGWIAVTGEFGALVGVLPVGCRGDELCVQPMFDCYALTKSGYTTLT